MPPVAAIVGGIGSLIGGAAAGVAGLAAGAASAIGSVASGILGGAAGLGGGAVSAVGGGISALMGGGAAPTIGAKMAAIAEPAYYGLGVPAATGGVATGLSSIFTGVQAGVGIYGQLAQLEISEGMSETEKIKAQTKLMEAEALKVYAAKPPALPPAAAPANALPTLSAQPIYVAPAAAAAAPSYLLYAGLAILAFILLRKK